MRYVDLPYIPVPLSRIAMGSTYIGTDIDEKRSLALLDTFAEEKGTVIDTARVYGQTFPGGESASERLIGRWLRQNGIRDQMVIVTKGLHPTCDWRSRYNEQNLKDDVDQSREALGCDVLDIWFLHRDDPAMPVDEIMDMASWVVTSGAARALGASNWSVEKIDQANRYAHVHHLPPFVASEIQWSLAVSSPERWGDPTLVCMDEDSLSWYLQENLVVFAYSSQAKGFFSKAMSKEGLSEKSRSRFLNETNLKRLERVRELMEATGLSPAAIAVAYITSQQIPTIALVGCSSVEQLRDTLSGADVQLTASQLDFLVAKDDNDTA